MVSLSLGRAISGDQCWSLKKKTTLNLLLVDLSRSSCAHIHAHVTLVLKIRTLYPCLSYINEGRGIGHVYQIKFSQPGKLKPKEEKNVVILASSLEYF